MTSTFVTGSTTPTSRTLETCEVLLQDFSEAEQALLFLRIGLYSRRRAPREPPRTTTPSASQIQRFLHEKPQNSRTFPAAGHPLVPWKTSPVSRPNTQIPTRKCSRHRGETLHSLPGKRQTGLQRVRSQGRPGTSDRLPRSGSCERPEEPARGGPDGIAQPAGEDRGAKAARRIRPRTPKTA